MALYCKKSRDFKNGSVYLLMTEDGFPIETTDTFLPMYTKNAMSSKSNSLTTTEMGSRCNRWMVGVSCMSGCPVRCKFCATGKLKKWKNLTADEIVEQVEFVINKNSDTNPQQSGEFKINYTRMGEPFLNIDAVKEAIERISGMWPNTHHYISTIGILGSDFTWIKGKVTLQLSLHALNDIRRNWLIPYQFKMGIFELGLTRTQSDLKTTLNLTLVDKTDFDIVSLQRNFDPKHFFVKLSPINKNEISDSNDLGNGVISGMNLI